MRYLFAILFVCIFNLAIVDMTRGEVREMMLVCGLEHGLKDSNIYIHITPENLSMEERNSQVRDKTKGQMIIVLFPLNKSSFYIIEHATNISESIDKKYYEGSLDLDLITLDREALVLRLFSFDGNLLSKDECGILDSNILFDDHVQQRLDYLQEIIS